PSRSTPSDLRSPPSPAPAGPLPSALPPPPAASGSPPSALRPLPSAKQDSPSARLISVIPIVHTPAASTGEEQAKKQLNEADALFLAKKYTEAAELYAKAQRAMPTALKGA